MIGLTCSWAWSMVLCSLLLVCVSSPPRLSRGGGELSLSASLSFSLLFPAFLSVSIFPPALSLCPFSLMTNLSAAPVVVESGCSACEWMRCTPFFFLYESISVCPAQCLRSCSISHQFLIWTQMEGFLFGWCRREGSLHFASLHSVVPFWKSLRLETSAL